jgi:hypothetical protein
MADTQEQAEGKSRETVFHLALLGMMEKISNH